MLTEAVKSFSVGDEPAQFSASSLPNWYFGRCYCWGAENKKTTNPFSFPQVGVTHRNQVGDSWGCYIERSIAV
jgi:hypothetical protein